MIFEILMPHNIGQTTLYADFMFLLLSMYLILVLTFGPLNSQFVLLCTLIPLNLHNYLLCHISTIKMYFSMSLIKKKKKKQNLHGRPF